VAALPWAGAFGFARCFPAHGVIVRADRAIPYAAASGEMIVGSGLAGTRLPPSLNFGVPGSQARCSPGVAGVRVATTSGAKSPKPTPQRAMVIVLQKSQGKPNLTNRRSTCKTGAF